MKRGYTAMEYKSTVRKLRAIRPDLAMSSDFIVGFPGETEDDFNKMMKLIDDMHFDNSFSFIFSPRPGTPAAGLHDDTPHDVKLRRLQHLQSVINANIKSISESRVGTVQRILVEGASKRDSRRADGPHRMQPRGQLRRPAPPGGPDGGCDASPKPRPTPCAARCWCARAHPSPPDLHRLPPHGHGPGSHQPRRRPGTTARPSSNCCCSRSC